MTSSSHNASQQLVQQALHLEESTVVSDRVPGVRRLNSPQVIRLADGSQERAIHSALSGSDVPSVTRTAVQANLLKRSRGRPLTSKPCARPR